MMLDASELTEIEQDALAEIANLGVSRAASSLRQMVGEQVLLSVPAVKIVTRQAASKLVERNNAKKVLIHSIYPGFDSTSIRKKEKVHC